MKKTIVSGLVLSMIPGLCLGVNDRIYKLMQEKQEKMEKLEKCQGTTKNLKIAGLSTLGITAVGVGTNIAEAVVLNDYKSDVSKAKDARDAQLKIKQEREAAERAKQNALMSAATATKESEQGKYVVKIDFRHESLSYADAAEKVMQWGRNNGQSFSDCGYRHDNNSDYITCKNTDSKIWMFKFNAILDRQAEVKGVQPVTINKSTLPYEEAVDEIEAWAAKNKVDVFACSQKGKDKITCGGETVDYEFTFGMGGGTITTDGTKYTSQSICQKHCSGLCLEERDSTGRWDCAGGGNNADAAAKKAEQDKKTADLINSLGKGQKNSANGEKNEKVEPGQDIEKSKQEYYDNLRQQAKTVFDIRTMSPDRALEAVTTWGHENGITLTGCDTYFSDNTVVCDNDFEFKFSEIINVRDRVKQEAKNYYVEDGSRVSPTNAIALAMEFAANNDVDLKGCKTVSGSNTVTCDGGFQFNFAKIIWSRDHNIEIDYTIKTYNEALAAIQNQYPQVAEEDGFSCNLANGNKINCFTKDGEYRITHRFIFKDNVPTK